VDDAKALAELFAAVAEERDWIATEPPVDIDARAAHFASTSDSLVVAEADSQIIGMLYLEVSPHGFGEISMHVDRDWRGRGVGSALMQAAIGLADKHSLHKLCLEVFAHNTAAIASTGSGASLKRGGAPGSIGGPAENCGTRSSWAWGF
jgi:L-amino acid N-acyltransferase YncA